ncbi:AP-4 complex accessory subunit tepsin [Biomphalaria pfeifferi]|uniref:AP-4 complex accessory subunit tepsin n=1 Tax=Biomphalaria pfeifferi TaxID=112525 RepID=A0AAD8F3A1_BIOPF|nr:AP-4 complex accessory subunit tepsin [Biomphalaria pfeifferi]
MNSTSQRLTFVNKISILLKATSDDENATPGYMFREINDISFESSGYCESLAEFLIDRVRQKSCNIKFKALKVIKYLTENGSLTFQSAIRKYSDVIKECIKFGGPPHPMHGNTPYLSVRELSKELCEVLYNKDVTTKSPDGAASPEQPVPFKYGGLGPVQSKGTYQGFGNTPTNQTRGIEDIILDGIEKFGARITETAADRQAAVLAKLDLGSSTSNYKPPVVNYPLEQTSSQMKAGEHQHPTRTVKKHQPGKAGGGWGDEEDSDENDSTSNHPSMETDSLFDPSVRLQPEADWQEETDLVARFLRQGSTGIDRMYLSPSDLKNFLARCSSLSCDAVVEILLSKLVSLDAGVVLRALQLLESVIFNREELINIDTLAAMCKGTLVTCYNNCHTRLEESLNIRGSKNQLGNQSPWSSVKVKLAKVVLNLQKLSSHKDILPAERLTGFNSCVAPVIPQVN